jgi:hypothetical protein
MLGISGRLQRAWDAGEAYVRRHPRKSAVIGFGLSILPLDDIAKAVWKALPDVPDVQAYFARPTMPNVSWWNLTNIAGLVLLALVWRQTRKTKGLATSGEAWEQEALERLQRQEETEQQGVDGADVTDDLWRNEIVREHANVISERDELRKALEEAHQDRERIRGLLGNAEQEIRNCRREFGETRLRWFADRAKRNLESARKEGTHAPEEIKDVRATVRFAVYDDLPLAQEVQKILREHTQWPVELDGSNKPTLLPDPKGFKVLFDIGPMESFGEVASAFHDGRLINERVGMRRSERWGESEHLIIDVLPTKP